MKKLFTVALLSMAAVAHAQNLVNDGGAITIATGATITVPGNFTNTNIASVNNGGAMEVAGNFTASGNSIQSGAGVYRFNGNFPQTITLNGSYDIFNLELDNDSGLYVGHDMNVQNEVEFVSGKIYLNGHQVDVDIITGADSLKYFVCGNTGRLGNDNLSGGDTLFYPIGYSDVTYNPAWLVHSGNANFFAVRVFNDVLTEGITGASNSTDQHLVNRTWVINEVDTASKISYLKVQWNTADQRPLFNPSGNVGISYYIANTTSWSAIPGVLATGSNPYTIAQGFSPNPQNMTAFIVADENSAVSVDETAFSNLAIYPNPVNTGNTLQVNAKTLANKNVTLALYNSAGQIVFSEKKTVPAEGFMNTNLPNVGSGLYLLTITDGTSALYKGKLVVK